MAFVLPYSGHLMRFAIILLTIFTAVGSYLILSLELHGLSALTLIVSMAAILWLRYVFWEKDDEETAWYELFLQWLAFSAMGFLSFVLVTTLVRDLIELVARTDLHTERVRAGILWVSLGAFLLGSLNALFHLSVKKTEIPIEGLPEKLDGFKIVQLSDVHVGPTIRARAVERMAKLAREADPDLLVFTGDAVDGRVGDLSGHMGPFKELNPRFGKYYVPGNHEYYWGAEPWIQWFRSAGFHVLLNSNEVIQAEGASIMIAGVTDPAAKHMGGDAPDMIAARGASNESFPRILLAHQPVFAPEAEAAGFQLQISGHTHGGQFFPWTWVAGLIHRFPHGLRKIGKMWIYVSRGTGYWGPPVRLGAPAEVSLLILRRA